MSTCEVFKKTLLTRNSGPLAHSLLHQRLEPPRVGGTVGARPGPARLGFTSYPGRRQIIKTEAHATISREGRVIGRQRSGCWRRERSGVACVSVWPSCRLPPAGRSGVEGSEEALLPPPGYRCRAVPKIRCPSCCQLSRGGFHRDAPILLAGGLLLGTHRGETKTRATSRMMTWRLP